MKTISQINNKIDKLIDILDPAHKIILDDRGMIIIKLHNNDKANIWLKNNNLLPVIKQYHSPENTRHYDNVNKKYISTPPGNNALPFYCTIAIIPKNTKGTHIACCGLDIQRLSNIIFKKNESSGLICNGSYFFLQGHVENSVYGIDLTKDIYGNTVQKNNDAVKSFVKKPIGYFHYDTTIFGKHADKLEKHVIYNKTYDGYSLEKKDYINNDVYDLNNPKLTLDNIKDILGFIIFEQNGNTKIEKYSNYHDKTYINANVAMGNMLLYNGNIIMNEDRMCIAILLFSIIKLNLQIHDQIYLCDAQFNKLSGDEINRLNINDIVNFVSINDPTKRGKINFSPDNLFLPYTTQFIKKAYPTNYAGKIPPGFPNHASDLNPRTCIMKDENDNIIIIQVEGRHELCGGIGIDLFDLAILCKGLGGKYALNLDGGGSSKLLWKEKYNSVEYAGLNSYDISNAIFIS